MKINPIFLLTPPPPKGDGELNFGYLIKKSYILPENICGNFCNSSLKIGNLRINPIALLTPLSTKGDGIKFCLYNEKVLYLSPEQMLKVSKLCHQN